jgi:hypothetical protein
MTRITTRSNQYSENQPVLFLAFELGATKWDLGFSIGLGQKPRRKTIEAGDRAPLQEEIASAKKRFGLAKDAPFRPSAVAWKSSWFLTLV